MPGFTQFDYDMFQTLLFLTFALVGGHLARDILLAAMWLEARLRGRPKEDKTLFPNREDLESTAMGSVNALRQYIETENRDVREEIRSTMHKGFQDLGHEICSLRAASNSLRDAVTELLTVERLRYELELKKFSSEVD